MNKAQLVDAVSLDANITKVDAKKAVDAIIRTTIQLLNEGDKLILTGLGTFCVVHKQARMGRNPRTGAPVKIAPKSVVKFRSTLEIEGKRGGDPGIVGD
ncbi:MAG: HU family DNA-binding protein [Alistipes sp.]